MNGKSRFAKRQIQINFVFVQLEVMEEYNTMEHRVKVTVLDKKLYPELQSPGIMHCGA